MKYKISAMIAVSLCISSVRAFISIPIPATEGSRQIVVNRIAPQTNALETKLDTITDSLGSDLSSKVDRINNNMMIPITAAGSISTAGSYIFANDIVGNITVGTSNVSINFNQYKLTGQLIIGTAGATRVRLDFYNGSIESASGPCIITAGGAATSFDVAIDHLLLRQKDTSESAIQLNDGTIGNDYWIKNCIIVGNSKTATSHRGIYHDFSGTAARVTVENCMITNFYAGIDTQVPINSSMTIQNCLISNCGDASGGYAIGLTSSQGRYFIIRNNLLKDNGRGIYLPTAFFDYCLIFGNIITGCLSAAAGCAISDAGGENQIYGNFAYNNAGTNYSGVSAIETTVTDGRAHV